MWTLFFEFELPAPAKFDRLQKLFYALKESKEQGALDPDDARWFDYFQEDELQQFWWPTQEEVEERSRLWASLPFEQRLNDPRLDHPWDFSSWLDALANGEYELQSCERTDAHQGRLEFGVWSFPYGGAGAFRFLLQVFGARITREDA